MRWHGHGANYATDFPLKSATDKKIIFENPKHDFPQRIIYWRDGDKLCARAEGTMQGKDAGEQWCWTRQASGPRPQASGEPKPRGGAVAP